MLSSLFNFLFPSCCILCNRRAHQQTNLCRLCLNCMPWLENYCYRCANPLIIPLRHYNSSQICGQCLRQPPLFDQTVCLFNYKKPASSLITQLKFHQRLIVASTLGHLLSVQCVAAFSDNRPDLLIPVPLHNIRLRKRGFNQSLEIAKLISRACHIPIEKTALTRIRETKAQSELPSKQRAANVRNAFRCTKSLNNQHIALIDDVITTGHTINECCKALRAAGAVHITVCAVAKSWHN